MDIPREHFASLKKTFDTIVELMDPVDLEIKLPEFPQEEVNAQIGRIIRDFSGSLDKFLDDLLRNRQVQSETRGMSGTKNEQLRDLLDHCKTLVPRIKTLLGEYIDQLIRDVFSKESITQFQMNEILSSEPIVSHGNIDKIALTKLRKFTREHKEADYYEYIRSQRADLYGTLGTILRGPLDRFGLIPKSAKKGSEIWPGGDSPEKIREIILGSNKNTIVLGLNGSGYAFGTVVPQADDVTVPVSIDFINRMKIVTQYPSGESTGNIFHMPNPGKVTSIYETYDFNTFFFMTPGLNGNLVSYQRALGYYYARTFGEIPGEIPRDKIPSVCHLGYNNEINKIFSENYYRHDLTLLATEFKFGSGITDSIKDRLKDLMVSHADKFMEIDIAQLIRQAINDVLPKDITRESAVTSYLGTIRLIDEFKKEYLVALRETNWESHKHIAMVDVFNRCVAKCDKLNAWAIDFRSPKDLFWK